MADYLQAAIKYVDTTADQVLAHRLDEARQVYVLVVDNGIKGCPKYSIPLSDLAVVSDEGEAETEQETAVTDEPEGEAEKLDPAQLKQKTVDELQAIARERDIAYSGLRKAELIEALSK